MLCYGSTPVADIFCIFFFQAEDGIRDADVTGVQTCALPIYLSFEPCCFAVREPIPRYVLNFLPLKMMVSPGDSSVPASIDPIITEDPPAARALTMSPE